MAAAPLQFPSLSFGEIAARLVHYANEAARACHDGEIIVARFEAENGGKVGLGVSLWIEEKRSSALMAGELQRWFAAAAPYEQDIRTLMGDLASLYVLQREDRAA